MDYIFNKIILAPADKNFITYRILCSIGKKFNLDALCLNVVSIQFQSNKLSSQFMMSFTMAFMSGLIIAFPYILSLIWGFVKPALKQQESSKIKFIVFWMSMLFFFGIAFGYYIICPYTISFFASYTLSPMIENNFLISDYIAIMQQIILGSGLVFQLPLIIYFLAHLGMISSNFLKKYRRYAIVIILFIAAIITPPDVLSQIIVTIPLWFLYEIGILITIKIEKNASKAK